MKRCPECRRDYYDETLLYCLDDGTALLDGPTTADEARTAIFEAPVGAGTAEEKEQLPTLEERGIVTRTKAIVAGGLAVILLVAALVGYLGFWRTPRVTSRTPVSSQPQITSLAVLPLKPLDAGDNYLGIGIADAIIRRISQTGQLSVRPTSAIRRYLNEDVSAIDAAKQLDAEAVLEGTIQRANDHLRVTVNLLRTSDQMSMWNESFDMEMKDIFAVQDSVSQQIAARLSLKLDPSQQAQLSKAYTADPAAYELYQKGIYTFNHIDKEKTLAAIDLFKKAIDVDPKFALAHAELAYAYAEMATFKDPTNPQWAELVKQELDRAAEIDPQLAEIHLVRSLISWSVYGGYKVEAAIRELRTAQQLNPSLGHTELAELFSHVGLADAALREMDQAIAFDPTSDFVKEAQINHYWLAGDYDKFASEQRRLRVDALGDPDNSVWYLLGKRRLDEAQKQIDRLGKDFEKHGKLRGSSQVRGDSANVSYRALLDALRGNFRPAEDAIPLLLSLQPVQDPYFHHITYNIACIYAIEGKSAEAVKWLRKTAETGYPCYPRFDTDPYLDRIREQPEFSQFMAEMKSDWEAHRSEFDNK